MISNEQVIKKYWGFFNDEDFDAAGGLMVSMLLFGGQIPGKFLRERINLFLCKRNIQENGKYL